MKTSDTASGPAPEKIRKMFSEIAPGYDKANSVLSIGIHHLWRKKLVAWSGAKAGNRVLDCATGTGDLAIEFKKKVGSGEVLGTDFCAEMLVSAPLKAEKAGFSISFSVADVLSLPFPDRSFDIASIAFGIRNVADPLLALKELARVTKPGGKVMILEFGQPAAPGVAQVYRFYSQKILPIIGGWVTGKPKAYEYLQTSSSQFPSGNDFLNLMRKAGVFKNVESKALSLSIAFIYMGTVE